MTQWDLAIDHLTSTPIKYITICHGNTKWTIIMNMKYLVIFTIHPADHTVKNTNDLEWIL